MKIRNGIKALLGALLAIPGAQAWAIASDYAPGFVWDRSADWVLGTVEGSTLGNAAPDKKGNPVWRYEWTTGGDLDSANPWYLQQKNLMTWDNWNPPGPPAEQLWSRADNLEPKITQWLLTQSRSATWHSWEYQSVVRWINPVSDGTIVSITGTPRLVWEGFGGSPDVDVEVVLVKKDESDQTVELLYVETIANPTPGAVQSNAYLPMSFMNERFDLGDSLFLTMRAATAPSPEVSWILLLDDLKITYVTAVPEPSETALLAGGLVALGVVVRRGRRMNRRSIPDSAI